MPTNNIGSRRTTLVLAGIFIVLTFFTIWSILGLRNDLNSAESERKKIEEQQAASSQAASQLAEQVKDLGGRPVVDPEDLESLRGEQGIPGIPGRPPSSAEISLAVQSFCSGGRCDGNNPTASQVAQAVASYCNNRGECRGDQGEVGDRGPGPTGNQVASAVETYCAARNNCTGPQGVPGDKGDTGAKGDKGEKGDKGDKGERGEAGESLSFPFTFSFTIPASALEPARTFTCTVPSATASVTCTEA